MDTSFNVSPGEKWHPESASRFNTLSDMINRFETIGPAAFQSSNASTVSVTCQNVSKQLITAGSYVTILPAPVNGKLQPNTLTMQPGTADPCGVILNDCAPGQTAEVQVYGVAEAKYAPAPASVLTLPGGSSFIGRHLVVLNSTGHHDYKNYFKVEAVSFDKNGRVQKVRIYDSGAPDSGYSGMTDLGPVPVCELSENVSSGNGIFLNLIIHSDDQGIISFEHRFSIKSSTESNENEPCILLAEVVNAFGCTQIVQRWTSGKIYWRNRFIIKEKK